MTEIFFVARRRALPLPFLLFLYTFAFLPRSRARTCTRNGEEEEILLLLHFLIFFLSCVRPCAIKGEKIFSPFFLSSSMHARAGRGEEEILLMDIMWPSSQSHFHLSFIFIEMNFHSLSFLSDVCNEVHEHME